MILTHFGREFFKLQSGDTVVAYNPISKESTLKQARFGSDLVLIAMNHPDFNGVQNASFKDKNPFVVSGPGEYEISGIFIKGYLARSRYESVERIVTSYALRFEGMNMVFLGPLSQVESVDASMREKFGEIDVLFVPVSGGDVLGSSEAYKLAVSLSPRVIIPMHWDHEAGREGLKAFLKDAGAEIEPVDKFTFKRKDIEAAEGEIVVIEPAHTN